MPGYIIIKTPHSGINCQTPVGIGCDPAGVMSNDHLIHIKKYIYEINALMNCISLLGNA